MRIGKLHILWNPTLPFDNVGQFDEMVRKHVPPGCGIQALSRAQRQALAGAVSAEIGGRVGLGLQQTARMDEMKALFGWTEPKPRRFARRR